MIDFQDVFIKSIPGFIDSMLKIWYLWVFIMVVFLISNYKVFINLYKKIFKKAEKCLRCGGDLKSKKGKYGKFMGCSNYPDCKYTKKPTY